MNNMRTKKTPETAVPEEDIEQLCSDALAHLGEKYFAARKAGDQAKAVEIWDECRLWLSWRRQSRIRQLGGIAAEVLSA
jgi:hypothetical protein